MQLVPMLPAEGLKDNGNPEGPAISQTKQGKEKEAFRGMDLRERSLGDGRD